MTTYIMRRVLQIIPTILSIVVVGFIFLRMLPGDPVSILAAQSQGASVEYMEEMRARLGLDQSVMRQLGQYIINIINFRLGDSIIYQDPVVRILLIKLGPTLLLMISALIFAVVGGVGIGLIAGVRKGSVFDRVSNSAALLVYGMPSFWLALMAILIFSVKLQWLPFSGIEDVLGSYTGIRRLIDISMHLIMPASTLGTFYLIIYYRIMRNATIVQRHENYVMAIRAKGAKEWYIMRKHILPNAVLPVITLAGVQSAQMLGGSIIIETVYDWPGLGRLAFEAVSNRDYNVLLGLFIISGLLVVVINLLTDILTVIVDPRVRLT